MLFEKGLEKSPLYVIQSIIYLIDNFVMSSGGLRISVIKGVFARLEWAKAIGRNKPASGNGPSTFYFSIQSEI